MNEIWCSPVTTWDNLVGWQQISSIASGGITNAERVEPVGSALRVIRVVGHVANHDSLEAGAVAVSSARSFDQQADVLVEIFYPITSTREMITVAHAGAGFSA